MNEQKNYSSSCLLLFEQYRLAFKLPVGKLRQRSNYSRISTKLRNFDWRKVKASALRVISLLFGSGMKAMTTQCLLLRTSHNIHVYFHEIKRFYIIPCVSIFQHN